MSPEELDRHFAHGSAIHDGDDDDIMERIAESYKQSRRDMGWWGRWLEDHYGGPLVKPPFLPWMPDGFGDVAFVSFITAWTIGLVYILSKVIDSCSK